MRCVRIFSYYIARSLALSQPFEIRWEFAGGCWPVREKTCSNTEAAWNEYKGKKLLVGSSKESDQREGHRRDNGLAESGPFTLR
jgi:hypothetical protein